MPGIKDKVVVITGASSESVRERAAEYGQLDLLVAEFTDCPILLAHRKCSSMNPNKALWEKGDFTRIAATMRESGEALVQRLGITKGLRLLDLGSAHAPPALPAPNLGTDP